MTLPVVYVAGPYTHPDPVINTRVAVDAGMKLYDDGLAYPVIPHLSLFVHYVRPQADVEYWYAFDLHIISRCDAVWRLEGASTGADREVEYARRFGTRVFEDEMLLRVWLHEQRRRRERLAELREMGAR